MIKMKLEEYRVKREEIFALQKYDKEDLELPIAMTSLTGEVGELANEIKKLYRDDGGLLTQERKDKLILEGGDIIWYLMFLFEDILHIPLEVLFGPNISKLRDKYGIEK